MSYSITEVGQTSLNAGSSDEAMSGMIDAARKMRQRGVGDAELTLRQGERNLATVRWGNGGPVTLRLADELADGRVTVNGRRVRKAVGWIALGR